MPPRHNWNIVMMFNATFNNISVISWRSVLLVEETRVSGENHRPVASHWQTISHNIVSSTPHMSGLIHLNLQKEKSEHLLIKTIVRLMTRYTYNTVVFEISNMPEILLRLKWNYNGKVKLILFFNGCNFWFYWIRGSFSKIIQRNNNRYMGLY